MLGKYLSSCWESWGYSCFTVLCLILCASFIYFLSRFLCIGSMLDLNVVCLFSFAALLCASTLILLWASLHACLANGFKEALIGRQPKQIRFLFLLLCIGCFYYCSNTIVSLFLSFVSSSSLIWWGKQKLWHAV